MRMVALSVAVIAVGSLAAAVGATSQNSTAATDSAAAMIQPAQSSPVIPAVAEPNAIPLYAKATAGEKNDEIWFKWFEGQVVSVRNVTYPTITPVLPDPAKATGSAVIVAPGGAFEFLSM